MANNGVSGLAFPNVIQSHLCCS